MNARFVHPTDSRIVAHNYFEIVGNEVRMELTQGEFAVFDLADLPMLSQYRWCSATFRRRTYAISPVRRPGGKQDSLRMHRLTMGVTDPNVLVDHQNLDGLFNCRANLRVATRPQNGWNCPRPRTNTSGYKGVTRNPKSGKYSAGIKVNGKQLYLGHFDNPVDAARAYDEAAHRHHGAFARTNF